MIESQLNILEPSGYITAANVNEFQETLTNMIVGSNYHTCLVDMYKVEFLDSAGLMALVYNFRLAQSLGKKLNICSLAPSVKIIFELTQLDKVIPIYDDRESFLMTLKQPIAA
jgi:anti-sigma B factor antagonist